MRSTIGPYEVVEEIGSGTFAMVYRCHAPRSDDDVAVKLCLSASDEVRARLAAEADIVSRLDHPNIVRILDAGETEDGLYLVEELLAGEDLASKIAHRVPLSMSERLGYLAQIARGLGYAHSQGVLHRDVCPGNVRVLDDDSVKLLDFGIARLASSDVRLTRAGTILGTAGYLPPEQVLGREIDQRADLFSFGALAYHLLTYEAPFPGEDLKTFLRQVLQCVPPPVSDLCDESPPELDALVAQCMEKEPEDRPLSFLAVLAELESISESLRETGEIPVQRLEEATPDAEAALSATSGCGTVPLDVGANSEWQRRARVLQQASRRAFETCAQAWTSLRWTAVGAAAMAVIAVGWWTVSRRTGAEEIPPSMNPSPIAVAAPIVAVTPAPSPEGRAVIVGLPWGELVSLEAQSGEVLPGLVETQTPLSVTLPIGRYRAVLSSPHAAETRVCYFEVEDGTSVQCRVQFFDQRASDHFSEAGWWR